jgi:hypothetical protein
MALKQLPEDFKDFISFLNKNNVRYLLSMRRPKDLADVENLEEIFSN